MSNIDIVIMSYNYIIIQKNKYIYNKMNKWNKPQKQLTEQFIKNEQRRRQMIIQASKKRRQKQKKLQQINNNIKKKQQQALQKHKKQKQQQYQKYLKNNYNIHDKYQQIKRNQKIKQSPKRNVSKWKNRQKSQNKTHHQQQNQINQHDKLIIKKKLQSKLKIQNQFIKQWEDQPQQFLIQQQMIGSKLIDSLDLDADTLFRGRQLTNKLQKTDSKTKKQPPNKTTKDLQQMKQLIGYQSILISIDNVTQPQLPISKIQSNNQIKNKKTSKSVIQQKYINKSINQQQAFNNLKHNKQGKIFQWAHQKSEQADDLFSNCSEKKNSITKLSMGSNKKLLQPIPEKMPTSQKNIGNFTKKNPKTNNTNNQSFQKVPNNSQKNIQNQQKKPSTKLPTHPKSTNKSTNEQQKKPTSKSKQKQRQKSTQKIRIRKCDPSLNLSQQKKPPHSTHQKNIKTHQPFPLTKNPPIPPKPPFTILTQQLDFNVQSFIKNDLLQLNHQQQKLQQEIVKLHKAHKQQKKQIYTKYDIKINYQTTDNLIKHHQQHHQLPQKTQTQAYSLQQYHPPQNQDMIEESIQRLDDFMLKKQINSKQKKGNQPSTHSTQSIINPFSKPQEFYKQVLQLAQNISKFQKQPKEDIKGYAYKQKMKKKDNQKSYIPQQILSQSKNIEQVKRPQQNKKYPFNIPHPPLLQYSNNTNEVIQVNFQQRYFNPIQDSLDERCKDKIQCNQKLKNILFD